MHVLQELGWRGVHIEGDPVTFQYLIKNRPNQIAVQAVVCREGKDVKWMDSDLSLTSGNLDTMDDRFANYWHNVLGKDDPDNATLFGQKVNLEKVCSRSFLNPANKFHD